jgi:hypothetical protein
MDAEHNADDGAGNQRDREPGPVHARVIEARKLIRVKR